MLQDDKNYYWVNPQVALLEEDWSLVLNDTNSNELIVLNIPAGSLQMESVGCKGLIARADKQEQINLRISSKELKDLISGEDFSDYVKARLKY